MKRIGLALSIAALTAGTASAAERISLGDDELLELFEQVAAHEDTHQAFLEDADEGGRALSEAEVKNIHAVLIEREAQAGITPAASKDEETTVSRTIKLHNGEKAALTIARTVEGVRVSLSTKDDVINVFDPKGFTGREYRNLNAMVLNVLSSGGPLSHEEMARIISPQSVPVPAPKK